MSRHVLQFTRYAWAVDRSLLNEIAAIPCCGRPDEQYTGERLVVNVLERGSHYSGGIPPGLKAVA